MHENATLRSLFVVGIVVASVFIGVAIPGTVAAQDTTDNETTTDNGTSAANGTTMATASLTANPTTAGVASNHTVNITVGDTVAGNLTTVRINYTGTTVSTSPIAENVTTAIIANRSIPVPSNVTFGSTGFTETGVPAETIVSFELNQSLQPEAGDQLTLAYKVQNPSEPGTYTVDVVLNPQTDAVVVTTNLTVTPNEATPTPEDNGTTVAETTTGMTTTGGASEEATTEGTITGATVGETTESGAGDGTVGGGGAGGTTSSGNGPGFTLLVGIVGILAVALLAMRRN